MNVAAPGPAIAAGIVAAVVVAGAAAAVAAEAPAVAPPALPQSAATAPLGRPLEVLQPRYRLGSFTRMAEILPARTIARGGPVRELPQAARRLGDVAYDWNGTRRTLADYFERHRVMAFVVLQDGRVVHETYRLGTTAQTQFVSWSMAKSVASTLIGFALADGAIASLDDPLVRYLPRLAESGYRDNTVRDLLHMTSGVKFIEDYAALDSLEGRAWIEGTVNRSVPSYADTFLWFRERLHPPGTRFYYASIEPAILVWLIRAVTGQHPSDYLSQKLWRRIGAEHDASWVLDRPGGLEIGSCCINATARDYARLGQLFLDDGRVGREQVLPAGWVGRVRTPDPARPFLHARNQLNGKPYGYQYYWWLWPDEAQAISAHGVHGQQITIDFDDGVVIVMTADWDKAVSRDHHHETHELQRAIVAALRDRRSTRSTP
jgi:CubicO group peptidase (beta-lactamase class C family)